MIVDIVFYFLLVLSILLAVVCIYVNARMAERMIWLTWMRNTLRGEDVPTVEVLHFIETNPIMNRKQGLLGFLFLKEK